MTTVDHGRVGAAGDRSEPALLVQDVSVRFGGLVALDGVSLRVERGQVVSLIGPNGAGKTTLFNVISGFLAPNAGRVFLDGEDVSSRSSVERARRGVVRTFQRMQLFEDLTVLENLVVSRELERPMRLIRGVVERHRFDAGDRVDAEEVAAVLGLSGYLGTKVTDMPTGLRRLVELGRGLMVDARLLLLDEPSSGLDPAETARFNEVIRGVQATAAGESVLLVEHDMSVALGLADWVYVLDFGRLIAEGTPDQIREHPGVQAAYLGVDT